MAIYSYIAANKQGKKITGEHDAETRDEVALFLHEQELVVISIQEKIGIDWKKLMQLQIGGIPLKDKVIFAKQLSTMMSAGLPLIQALDILVQQSENPGVKEKLLRVYKAVEAGSSLSQAFSKEKSMFNELQINLLVAGEKSGSLPEVMSQISEDLEKSKELRGKIVGAMIYPIIIVFVMIIVLALMLVFMIPSVKELYLNLGGPDTELPFITNLLINLSGAITSPFGIFVAVLLPVVGYISFRYAYSTISGRRFVDRILLRIPVFGGLNTKVQLTLFNRLLSMLLKSGVPIIDALKIVSNSLGNILFKEAVAKAATEVSKGNSISIPLAESEVFPLTMVKMMATGEETGKLEQITADMSKYYEAEVNEITGNLTKLMEPFILLLVGGLVGFLAVAIYLPLFSIGSLIT